MQGARLWGVAAHGTFANDECFHAYAAEWIAAHHAIPRELPALYGGLYYYYQPLLHLLGAGWIAAFGKGALHVLPVALWAATALALLFGARRAVPAGARGLSAALFVLNPSLTAFGLLLYAEGLTTFVFAAIAVRWIAWRAAPSRREAVGLGATIGIGLLAKFTAWLPLVAIVIVALVLLARGRRERGRELLIAALIAALIALPWWIRNQALYGSALYPAFAPDMDRALFELSRRRATMPAGALLGGIPLTLGVPLLLVAAGALVAALLRRRGGAGLELMAAAGLFALASAFAPMAAPRHLYPFVPLLALGASWTLVEALRGRRPLALAFAIAAALAITLGVAATRRDLARVVEPGAWLTDAYDAVRANVPEGACVLSVWTYDTCYHSGRPATWPIAWGQRRRPLEAFTTEDPEELLAVLHRDGIAYVLAPLRAAPQPFDGGNYSESLMSGLRALMSSGDARPVWSSERLVLLAIAPAR